MIPSALPLHEALTMTATMSAIPTRAGVRPAHLGRAFASRALIRPSPALAAGVRTPKMVKRLSPVSARAGASIQAPGFRRTTQSRTDTKQHARTATIANGYGGVYGRGPERGGGIVPVPDRLIALLPYLVPLLDGLRYSRFFFQQFPQAVFLLQPLQPLAGAYYRIPFAGVISFFAIYMGLAENKQMSRFVRFNAMQAIIVDVCLVLPGMIEYAFSPGRLGGVAMEMYKLCYNCVWVVVLASFCLAAVGCLGGQMFKLPFVGDAADMRI